MGKLTKCDRCGAIIESSEAFYELQIKRGATMSNDGWLMVGDLCRECRDDLLEIWMKNPKVCQKETTVENIIDTLPTIDIVRCKDCIHRPRRMWESVDGFGLEFPDYVCPCYCDDEYYSFMPKDDFFCARGERKTNE